MPLPPGYKPPRLTNPVGTNTSPYNPFQGLSPFGNPAGATSGFLGGAQPSNIPQIGAQVGSAYPPTVAANQAFSGFGNWLKNIFAPKPPQLFSETPQRGLFQPFSSVQGKPATGSVAFDAYGNQYTLDKQTGQYTRGETNAFKERPTSTQANTLVGSDLTSRPTAVAFNQIQQILSGRSRDQILQTMQEMGYQWVGGPHGGPGSFVLTGNASQPSAGASMFQNSQGEWFDAASLEPGERNKQVLKGGGVVRGGTPVQKDIGNTPAGTGQYALTVGQNLNKRLEAKGAYKWQSKVQKDQNGNWQRVYYKVLRGPYTRQGRQHHAQVNAGNKNKTRPDSSANQLVTMRADFG